MATVIPWPATAQPRWPGCRSFSTPRRKPVGPRIHPGESGQRFACYSFVPKSDIPIKFIVLDDTVKGPDQPNYAAGALDDARYQWLVGELQAGQAANQLMVICAHVPIKPQNYAHRHDSVSHVAGAGIHRRLRAQHAAPVSQSHPVDGGTPAHECRDPAARYQR